MNIDEKRTSSSAATEVDEDKGLSNEPYQEEAHHLNDHEDKLVADDPVEYESYQPDADDNDRRKYVPQKHHHPNS